MKLVEQHVIEKGDPRYTRIEKAAFASKNLWNLANYYVRQSFIFQHTYLDNTAVYHLVKSSDAYEALPAKVSNRVLVQLDKALRESYTSKASFLDRDPLPTYDPKLGVEQEDNPRFSGSRDKRWYRVKGRKPIHSDVNGSYNIGRKVFPTAFDGLGIEATAVRPRRLAV